MNKRLSAGVAVGLIVVCLFVMAGVWYMIYGKKKASGYDEAWMDSGMMMPGGESGMMPETAAADGSYEPVDEAVIRLAIPAAESGAEGFAPGMTAQTVAVERKIIKEATLSIEVKSVLEAKKEIVRLYESVGGFADRLETLEHAGSPPRLAATIRVPQVKFEFVLNQLRSPAFGVVRQDLQTGQDVTEEWVDLEARLRNLKRQEIRLLDILDRARKVEDILKVEKEIERVRGEIERYEGRLKFLAHKVNLATLHLSLFEPAPVGPAAPSKWAPGTEASRAWQGLVGSAQALINFLIHFCIRALPFLVLIGLLVWGVVRVASRLGWRLDREAVEEHADAPPGV